MNRFFQDARAYHHANQQAPYQEEQDAKAKKQEGFCAAYCGDDGVASERDWAWYSAGRLERSHAGCEDDGGDVYGAIVGWDIKLEKDKKDDNQTFCFDEALGGTDETARFVKLKWVEQ